MLRRFVSLHSPFSCHLQQPPSIKPLPRIFHRYVHNPNFRLHQSSSVLQCTIFNSRGDLILHNKDVERMEFMKRYNLAVRDFRKINRPSLVPELTTRGPCILINILNIRALIKSNVVVVFDHNTGGSARLNNKLLIQLDFYQEISTRLHDNVHGELPYELRALEAILIHVMQKLTTELKMHETVLVNITKQLEELIDRVNLKALLKELKLITQFRRKVGLIRELLEDTLDSDDDLNDLYLTHQRTGADHTEIELLLEHYLRAADEIYQKTETSVNQVRTQEEIINVILDSNRNELMMLGLKYSTGLLLLGGALWIAALYGMNLENFIEELDGGFEAVVTAAAVVLMVALVMGVKKLRLVGRLKLGERFHQR